MKRFGILFVMLCVMGPLISAQQRRSDQKDGRIHVVATHEIAAQLTVGSTMERITGRTSFNILVKARNGEALVRGFNIAFFGVQQKLLGGESASEPLGLLAFGVVRDKAQSLRYDGRTGELSGELDMFADASYLNAFAEPVEDGKNDMYKTPTIPAKVSVQFRFAKPLSEEIDEPERAMGRMELEVRCEGLRHKQFVFPELEIRLLEPLPVKVDYGLELFPFEPARKLCIQPVRILRFSWYRSFLDYSFPFFQFSGAGLAFGEPGARREWAKADVIFEIRDWKTILGSKYLVLKSPEENDLRQLVDDDDCIEVFFVYDFDPQDRWGGGATWGCGTGSAKIITSDGNARGGIDFTHLAHELGHVLGLHHPDNPGTTTCQRASTGSLMCPSGYLNDNPHVNSRENEDLLSNPLLTFTWKLWTPGPDCTNSADCGRCP